MLQIDVDICQSIKTNGGSYAIEISATGKQDFSFEGSGNGSRNRLRGHIRPLFSQQGARTRPGNESWARAYQNPGRRASKGRNFGAFWRTHRFSWKVDSKWPEIKTSVSQADIFKSSSRAPEKLFINFKKHFNHSYY